MIGHILFPFDFSSQSQQVAPYVRALAGRLHACVTLLGVVPPSFEPMPAEMGIRAGEDGAVWKTTLQSRLDLALITELAGLQVERATDAGDPGFRIVEYAHRHSVDLIMMPTHGLGLFRNVLIGSVTSKVLHDARCAVWTAAHVEHQRARAIPQTIVCAVDGTSESTALLRWAGDLSGRLGASLNVLHVVGSISDWPALERERRIQEEVRRDAHAKVASIQEAAGVDAPLRVAVGEIAATVTELARQEQADLIVIGRGSLQSPLGRLRTHAYGIIQRSPCPVLSV
jgi:nucleotide-binding universal stress UspA family protein